MIDRSLFVIFVRLYFLQKLDDREKKTLYMQR